MCAYDHDQRTSPDGTHLKVFSEIEFCEVQHDMLRAWHDVGDTSRCVNVHSLRGM